MGRSRLAYRAKHKGILSDNSRKQISEAHKAKRQEREVAAEVAIPEQIEPRESDEEEYLEGINILEEPKLYIRDSEYSDFMKENKINIDIDESVCVQTSVLE